MDFLENALDTVGDNDKSENHENVILGEYYEIKFGMQVSSKEEEYNLYNEYAFVQNRVIKSLKTLVIIKSIIN